MVLVVVPQGLVVDLQLLAREAQGLVGQGRAGEDLEEPEQDLQLGDPRASTRVPQALHHEGVPRHGVLQLGLHRGGAASRHHVRGVLTAIDPHDLELDVQRKQAEERLGRGLAPGLVPVEQEDCGARAGALDQPRVGLGRRRPEDRHGLAQSGGVQGHHVRIALDEDHPLLLPGVGQGAVVRVDDRALLEPVRLGGVDVLGTLRPGQQARPEADRPSSIVTDRDHQAVVEEVVGAAVLATPDQADALTELDVALPLGLEAARDLRAARSEAEAERLDDGAVEAPLLQVLTRCPSFTPLEGIGVERLRLVQEGEARVMVAVLTPAAATLAAQGLEVLLHADHLRRGLERVHEVAAEPVLEQLQDVPAGAAGAEAVPEPRVRTDGERGGVLLVQRAAGPEAVAALDRLLAPRAHEGLHRQAGLDLLDEALELVGIGRHGRTDAGSAGAQG